MTVVSIIQIGSNKNDTISVPVPNATALFLNISTRAWKDAEEIRKRNGIDSETREYSEFSTQKEAFDYYEQVLQSVTAAFSSLEAFANEMIPDDDEYRYYKRQQDKRIFEPMNKKQIERYLSLTEKFESVLPEALKTKSPKGRDFWGEFIRLKKIRHRISHMKTDDREFSGPDNPNIWHDLFRISNPPRQALKMIDFFLKETNAQPKWREACPLQ